jgi:alkylation response protein AidB-like acyl-CoA dehydrogenase
MDLLPSADQRQIRDSLCDVLASEAAVDRLRAHGAIGNPDAALWPRLGELGFLGVGLPEAQGGIGLSAAEEMLLYRELGRHLVSVGVFGLTLGAHVAALVDAAPLRDQLLAGATPVGLANPWPAIDCGADPRPLFHLFEATEADWVFVTDANGAGLYRRDDFDDIQAVPSTDATLALERARLVADRPRHWVPSAREALFGRARLLLSAYAVGLGEATRDMAVDYAKVREQFGKPIGSFQAIKHLCADMAIRSEAALCQASFAALVFAEARADQDFHVTASKIVATEAALKNSGQNIQVHGAFGFTAEANAHHFLKRAHVIDHLWGDMKTQRERLLSLATPL